MKLTHSHIYEQHIDAIFQSCINQDFIKTKMAALGARNIEVNIGQNVDAVTIEIIRETPVDVPNAFKSFMKPWSKMTQTEVWKGTHGGPYHCNITIQVHGAPLNIQGQMKLGVIDEGTAVVSITEVTCSIPFIGKALTNFLGDISKKAIEKEFEYIGLNV